MSYTAFIKSRCSSAFLNDRAESLKLITFVVFLFQIIENCKLALSEKMDLSHQTVFQEAELKLAPLSQQK